MRIGVDARVLAHRPTGVARYLSGLLRHWPDVRQDGERLELYVDRPPESPLPAGEARVLRWPFPGGDPAWRQLRLAAHVRRARPDVLFCPFYSAPLAGGVPSVVTVHDVSFAAHPEWFDRKSRLAFRLVGPSARRAARVITVSRFSAGEIERRLAVSADRIEVIPPGIDESWFVSRQADADGPLRRWLGFDGRYLLHLGAVHERRRPGRLVEALAALGPERRDVRLVVAGPTIAPSTDVTALAAEHGVRERVVRREWVPEELVRPLLAGAAALVYLSEYEGFGLPALEAMAVGTLVVASRRASLPEVLGDAAVWVEDDRPTEVARAVERVLAEPALVAELSVRGRKRARAFSWPLAARRTWDAVRRHARTSTIPPRRPML
jgi:glycosyltransferase involved in cell wall biosynthesis